MTDKQRTRLYFPAWAAALAVNWTLDRGTATLIENPPGGDFARQVDTLATQRAARLYHSVKADDLRRASHLVAIGRDKSSKELTNRELDRCLAFYRLLKDQYDLAASVSVSDPAVDERRRLEWAINNCGMPLNYVAAVAQATQGNRDWRAFDNRQLGLLVATLRNRGAAKNPLPQRALPRQYVLNRRTEHEPV